MEIRDIPKSEGIFMGVVENQRARTGAPHLDFVVFAFQRLFWNFGPPTAPVSQKLRNWSVTRGGQ